MKNLLVILIVSLFLISCGGGGGGSNDNIPPSGLYNVVGTWDITSTPDPSGYESINKDDCVMNSVETDYTETFTIKKEGDNFTISIHCYIFGDNFYEGPFVLTVNSDTYSFSYAEKSDLSEGYTYEFEYIIILNSDDTFIGTLHWANCYNMDKAESYHQCCMGVDNLTGTKK